MRDLKEEREDSGKKDCPISVDCWTSCLSGEINNWTVIYYMLSTMFVSVIIVISSIIIAVSEPQPKLFIEQIYSIGYTFIFSIFALFIFFVFISIHKRYQKIVEPLKKIRKKIISGELNTPDKIRECWEKTNKVRKKRCEATLDKSEIDDKSETMRTHSVNFWYALGGSCIAIGGVFFSGFSLVSGLLGLILVIAGLFMLWGAYRAETDLKFFVEPSWKVKDITPNTWLFFSFCLITVWVVLVWAIIVYRALT